MGKKNKKISNKIIYKKLKMDTLDIESLLEKRELVYEPIRTGDVYILKDPEYSKARNDIPNTKTIKFERPVIIMSIGNDQLVSIIPITTSPSIKECRYPIKIEYNKCSYALISQFTTVDRSRLYLKIGVIKEEIFMDILSTFKLLIQFNSSLPPIIAKEHRTVPMDNSILDIVRYNPFHVYYNTISDKMFLVVQLDNRDKIVFYFKNKENKIYENIIHTSFGILDLDTIYRINYDFYSDYYNRDIGVEFNLKIRNKIINKLKTIYNMNILNTKDTDYLTDFSKALSELSSTECDYISLFKKINKYIIEPHYQALVLTDDDNKILEFIEDIKYMCKNDIKGINRLISVLRPYIIESINIFKTNTSCLNYIKSKYPNQLKQIILHYSSNSDNSNESINPNLVENTIHFKKNIKWIASYIRNQNN